MPSSCNLTLCTLQIALSRLHDIYLVLGRYEHTKALFHLLGTREALRDGAATEPQPASPGRPLCMRH